MALLKNHNSIDICDKILIKFIQETDWLLRSKVLEIFYKRETMN